MATFTKFNAFVEALCEKKHDLGADTLKILLSNTAPDAAADAIKADVTEIAAGAGYVAGGIALTVTTSAQTGGVYKLIANNLTFTASGGPMGPFRYAILYNDTTADHDLIGWWDIGSPVTLADAESQPVTFDGTNGVLQLA